MLKDDELIGTFALARQEVRPFTDKQIELVTNFAAQAVIAIENARLLNELRQRTDDLTGRTADLTEALEQQTATSEVLQVISSTPDDLQPVFATMLENAVRICDAKFGNIYRWDGETLQLVATLNTPPAFAEERMGSPFRPNSKSFTGRMLTSKAVIHRRRPCGRGNLPWTTRSGNRCRRRTWRSTNVSACTDAEGERTDRCVHPVRQDVRPFTDKQIELVKNFAAQAVIAIENARLLNELRKRTDDLEDIARIPDQQRAMCSKLSVGQLFDLQTDI